MATAQPSTPRGQRMLLQNVSWQFYEWFSGEMGERPIRITYDRGNMELMSPSFQHETAGTLLGKMVSALAEELNIPIKAGKSTTFRREDLERGLEPDECFYTVNVPIILGRTEIDLSRDPPPDLAIEVDITRSSLDRLGIYAALGVPEIWRFDGHGLTVHVLRAEGGYEVRERGPSFPMIVPSDLVRFVQDGTHTDDTTLLRAFRAWVRAEILPNYPPAGDAPPPL